MQISGDYWMIGSKQLRMDSSVEKKPTRIPYLDSIFASGAAYDNHSILN